MGPGGKGGVDLRPAHLRRSDLVFAGNHRLAIFATGLYFVVGLALLRGIDVERGRKAALEKT